MSKDIRFREGRCAKGQSARGGWLSLEACEMASVVSGRKQLRSAEDQFRSVSATSSCGHSGIWTWVAAARLDSFTQAISWTNVLAILALFSGAMLLVSSRAPDVFVPQNVTPSTHFQLPYPVGAATKVYDGTRKNQSPNSGLMP
jgi:hypothetical protein